MSAKRVCFKDCRARSSKRSTFRLTKFRCVDSDSCYAVQTGTFDVKNFLLIKLYCAKNYISAECYYQRNETVIVGNSTLTIVFMDADTVIQWS